MSEYDFDITEVGDQIRFQHKNAEVSGTVEDIEHASSGPIKFRVVLDLDDSDERFRLYVPKESVNDASYSVELLGWGAS